jgi:hypothetical protein
MHRNALDPARLAAMFVLDGFDQCGETGGVHTQNVATHVAEVRLGVPGACSGTSARGACRALPLSVNARTRRF